MLATLNGLFRFCPALLLAFLVACQTGEKGKIAPGYFPPDIRVKTLAGDLIGFEELKGKVVLVNFWASWCAPCVSELVEFQKLYKQLGNDKLEIIAIGSDDSKENLQAVSEKLQLSYIVVFDETGLTKSKFGVRGFPETFIIDPSGRLTLFKDPVSGPALKVQGERSWSSPTYVQVIKSYFKAIPSSE